MDGEDLVGRTLLGRYRVLSRLGAGGMGAVYLARAEGAAGFTKPVVVKQIHPELTADRSASKMFIREARILSNIQHAGIVNVLDFGQQGGQYVMVLEYVHGYDLSQWANYHLQKLRRFPLELALLLSTRVLATLHHAHTYLRADGTRMTVVHRDVSPGNVLLDLDGQVKLADFGIARIYDEQAERESKARQFKGKFAYSAPELLEGVAASPQSDLYAWGVVLYQLLTGSNPFRAKRATDTVQRVLTVVPAPLSDHRPELPAGLSAVLARALSKERSDRFANAAEFAQALKPFAAKTAEEAQRELTEAVRCDFLSDMPDVLGIVPLSEREGAWRDADGHSLQHLTSMPPQQASEAATVVEQPRPTGGQRVLSVPDYRGVVERSRQPEVLAGATSGRSQRSIAVAVVLGVLALAGAAASIALSLGSPSRQQAQVVIVDRRPIEDVDASPKKRVPVPPPAKSEAEPGASGTPVERAQDAPTGAREVLSRSGAGPKGDSGESSDATRLSRAVQGRRMQFERCFEQHVATVEGAPQVTLDVTVGVHGDVTSAKLLPPFLNGTPLGHCVLAVARGVRFPSLGHSVSFSVPITAHASR